VPQQRPKKNSNRIELCFFSKVSRIDHDRTGQALLRVLPLARSQSLSPANLRRKISANLAALAAGAEHNQTTRVLGVGPGERVSLIRGV
jgi:hypothetical protein